MIGCLRKLRPRVDSRVVAWIREFIWAAHRELEKGDSYRRNVRVRSIENEAV
jgi:hypothetical protein